MARIRDSAVTVNSTATASMVCDMPIHVTGDLLVAFVAKDTNTAFTTPSNWNAIRTVISAGAAGGVYTKWAASGSEAVTFALTTETCSAVVISVEGAEAEITSAAAQINVVAAAFTFTRTTGSFTTDGFTAGQTVIMSGFTNAGNNGPKNITTITGSGTILTVTSVATLVNETGGGDELVKSTGLDMTAASGADDTSLPLAGIGVTTIANNCLILHGLHADIGAGISALPPWVNIFPVDTGADSLSVSYSFKPTAGAITAPNHWSTIITGVDERSTIIAVRDSGGDTRPPYIPLSTTPSSQISPLAGLDAVDAGAWVAAASIVITSLAGKTVTGTTIANTIDSGYNPFRASATTAGASSTTQLNHTEFNLTSTFNLTTLKGLLFGTWQFTAPRDYLDVGRPSQGGVYILSGSTTGNYKAWVVGGQFDKETTPDRQNYLIEVADSTTIYTSAGSADYTATDYWAFGSAGYYGAPSVRWSTLWSINEVILAGGSSAQPITFSEIIATINNGAGYIPLLQQAGALATIWCPIRFGGTEAIDIDIDLSTFQFPRRADEDVYTHFHCTNDKIGIEFYGTGSTDTLTFTNCLFTSPSSYYWRFNSSHSASTVVDFSGTSVVNATVTLRSTVTLSSVTFISCSEIVLNGADLASCTFQNQRTGASVGAVAFTSAGEGDGVTSGTFTSNNDGDLGHSIRITATGTYTFNNHQFSGGGPAKRSFNTGTGVDSGTDIVTVDAAHGYTDGDAIYYQDQGGAVTMGLTDGTLYYVNSQTSTTLSFHTTKANAIADTSKVNLTSTGSETHYIYSAKADVYNNSGGAVTLNLTNGADIPSIRESNASSTTINNTKTIAIHVEDTVGVDIANAQVYVQKTTPTAFTSSTGNSAGDGDLVVTQAIDSDIPQIGMVSVHDVSANQVMPYRYASWAGSTFTFPTEVTGTADAGGSGTVLVDSAGAFTTVDVKEGDTVRNTTDGSWAVVDEIDSATQLTTSALQGGSDNTWSAGDTYSFHKLAVTLVSAVDTVDVPLVNLQTDSNGDITKGYNYTSDLPVTIRVRSNTGATKYIPFNTSGTITTNGLTVNIVLQEDTEAT